VFARWQALELGFGYGVIAQRLESKQWRRVMGSVLASATTQLDEASLAWAAYLACGRGAVLSGPSALRRHGLETDATITTGYWVTVPAERHMSFRGVRTIRESLPSDDITMIDGMRVTIVSRSLVDTLRVLPVRFGQPLLDRALLRQWLTVEELTIRIHQFSGRRGIGQLRTHLSRVKDGARSEAERRLHELLNLAAITGWVADFKVFSQHGVLLAVLDVAFEAQRVALEVDGLAFHMNPEQFQRDRTRQNALDRQDPHDR
jgi:hypothetical protein